MYFFSLNVYFSITFINKNIWKVFADIRVSYIQVWVLYHIWQSPKKPVCLYCCGMCLMCIHTFKIVFQPEIPSNMLRDAKMNDIWLFVCPIKFNNRSYTPLYSKLSAKRGRWISLIFSWVEIFYKGYNRSIFVMRCTFFHQIFVFQLYS